MWKNIAASILAVTYLMSFTGGQVFAESINCQPEGSDTPVQYGDSVTCDSESIGDFDVFHFLGSVGDTIHFYV
jgi:hypothetical protein